MENPIGIETSDQESGPDPVRGRNSMENPIGIETIEQGLERYVVMESQLNGKPDRD